MGLSLVNASVIQVTSAVMGINLARNALMGRQHERRGHFIQRTAIMVTIVIQALLGGGNTWRLITHPVQQFAIAWKATLVPLDKVLVIDAPLGQQTLLEELLAPTL